MAHEAELLRRLEPAVRPAGAPVPNRPPTAPIERQSFDQLLDDAAPTHIHADDLARPDGNPGAAAMLSRLGTIVNIPNPTVLAAMPVQHVQDRTDTPLNSTRLVAAPSFDTAEAALQTP